MIIFNGVEMFIGVRSKLWYEGYEQRIVRKKNGFKHSALEWMVPTDRG